MSGGWFPSTGGYCRLQRDELRRQVKACRELADKWEKANSCQRAAARRLRAALDSAEGGASK